jgi:hypothetical protein
MYRMPIADASTLVPGKLHVYQGHVEGGPALFAVCGPDPTSEKSWRDQLVTAADQITGYAKDLAREM